MKNTRLILLVSLLFFCGCASIPTIRKAQYLSNKYDDQVQKDIFVISLIDARPNKKKDLHELLSNKAMRSEYILNPLKSKGYAPQLLNADTRACGSLSEINNISEMACLDSKLFANGNLFLLISIDQYIAPQGMGVNGRTKITGILYSRSLNSFVWKDSIEGNYDSINTMMYGLGGYAAKLMLKSMTPDFTFRSNSFGGIKELLNSVPPFPKNRNK